MKRFLFVVLLAIQCLKPVSAQQASPADSKAAKPKPDSNRTQPASERPFASLSSSKEEKIRELMNISRAEQTMTNVLVQMIGELKRGFPEAPDEFWEEFERELKFKDLINLCVPIYAKHLTEEDLDGLIKFYQSSLGTKLLTAMPQLNQEMFAAASAWGKETAGRVGSRLSQRGSSATIPAPAARDASSGSNGGFATRRSVNARATKPGDRVRLDLDEETTRRALLSRGLNPEEWDITPYGEVVRRQSVQAPSTQSLTLPESVHYVIQVKSDAGGLYFSEKEPKPFGNGYKFVVWPQGDEMIVNGTVVIRKVGKD